MHASTTDIIPSTIHGYLRLLCYLVAQMERPDRQYQGAQLVHECMGIVDYKIYTALYWYKASRKQPETPSSPPSSVSPYRTMRILSHRFDPVLDLIADLLSTAALLTSITANSTYVSISPIARFVIEFHGIIQCPLLAVSKATTFLILNDLYHVLQHFRSCFRATILSFSHCLRTKRLTARMLEILDIDKRKSSLLDFGRK